MAVRTFRPVGPMPEDQLWAELSTMALRGFPASKRVIRIVKIVREEAERMSESQRAGDSLVDATNVLVPLLRECKVRDVDVKGGEDLRMIDEAIKSATEERTTCEPKAMADVKDLYARLRQVAFSRD